MKNTLYEYMSFDRSKAELITESNTQGGKDLFMKGIFIQGDVRNQNQRIYPVREIAKAVSTLAKKINTGESIGGELDHPPELSINLDKVSHMITEMWMDGNDGHGKLKIIPTPMGNIAKSLLESGFRLGVSSRGSGNVDDNGVVSDFEIVTVDIVAQPSAPNAYPKAIYESLYNMKGGHQMFETARYAHTDASANRQVKADVLKFIRELKI